MTISHYLHPTKRRNCQIIMVTSFFIISSSAILFHLSKHNDNNFPSHFLTNWRDVNNQPIYSKLTQHNPKFIMIHHTGKKSSNKPLLRKMRDLYKMSTTQKFWGDVPYHFYIDRNGEIAVGRSIRYAPDTNTEFKISGYINIVLEGDFSYISKERPSKNQYKSLNEAIGLVKLRYGTTKIVAHNEKAKTLCPGKINFSS